MRAGRWFVIAALAGGLSGCAPKTAPVVPAVAGSRYPDFVRPTPPADRLTDPISAMNESAWLRLQAGDLRGAEREIAELLAVEPTFYPAQTTSAYIFLARKDAAGALTRFSRVAEGQPQYAPALVGMGLSLLAENRSGEAVEAFRRAVQADSSLTDVARQVDVLTLKALQDELGKARDAARAGQADVAIKSYRNAIAASPDSAFLYRELAGIERQHGDAASAVEHLRRATSLDPTDAVSHVALGDLLDQQGDTAGAVAAYTEALRIEDDPAVAAKRTAIRNRTELASLPEQYRAIERAAQITRADLAALIGVRLAGLVQSSPVRDTSLITDIRGHWAERWITPVARAGFVEAFANHTFQPRAALRRVDLAGAVARLLNALGAASPERASEWSRARMRFPDIAPGHLAYPSASVAVASGAMRTATDGTFGPTRSVSGAEAVAAIERIRSLAAQETQTVSGRR